MRGWNRVVGRRSGNAPSWLIFRLLGSCLLRYGLWRLCRSFIGVLWMRCRALDEG